MIANSSCSDSQAVLVSDETALIGAVDARMIHNWTDFEFVLSTIIENRLLKLY